jgi:hypothetical protein
VSLLKRERALEIVAVSGTVRVTINPKPAWLGIVVEAVAILIVFGAFVIRGWGSFALWGRTLVVWGIGGAVIAWFYQLCGSEIVEFDARKLVICKQILGWSRTSEYPVSDCFQLEWREPTNEGDTKGLQCKVGWRTVKFGDLISEDEAIEILAALQANLPDVAQQMCAMPDTSKKHFTTLDLS